MKIQCALSESQIKKLYSNVYGNMVEQGDAFNPEQYMKDLFNKIAKNSDVDTAAKFMQQVPSMIGTASFRPALEDFEIKTDSLKPLIKKFKKSENGIDNTVKFFRPQLDPDVEKELIEKKALSAFHIAEKTSDTVPADPFNYQTYSSLSTTFQEFISKNPNEDIQTETFDPGRRTIYSTLAAIREEANNNTPLRELVYQDTILKLKPVRLSEVDENLLDKTTKRLVNRAAYLKGSGQAQSYVTTPDNIFLMVISDKDGIPLQFNEQGDIVAEGGQLVYQFLREVRKDGNKFKVTDIYGRSEQIIDPAILAEKSGITLEEAQVRQQDEFKELYEFREKLIKGDSPLVDIVGVSQGISEIKPNALNLSNISIILEDNDHAIRTLSVVKSPRSGFEKGEGVITIKGVEYKVDRPNLTAELTKKIATVLTNKELTNKEKYDYVSQLLADKASNDTRKHELEYLEKTDKLMFSYSPTTFAEGYSKFIDVDLNSPEAFQQITDALTNASGKDGKYFSAKMTYSDNAIEKGYQDYDLATNTLSDDYQDYFALIKGLPNTKIFADISIDSRSFNSYMGFAIPNQFTEQLAKAQESTETVNKDDFFESMVDESLTPGEEMFNTLMKEAISTEARGWKTIVDQETGKLHKDNYYMSTYLTNQLKNNARRFTKETMQEVLDNYSTFRRPSKTEMEIIQKEFDKAFAPQVTKAKSIEEVQNEINSYIDPKNVPTPESNGPGDAFFLRKGDLPSDVSTEQVEDAKQWWANSPLNKHIGLKQVANIVNSNAYARFIAYGAALNGNLGMIEVAATGNMVDVYHEAWHGFSQLYLTKAEKKALYNEVLRRTGKSLSFFEIEELLAEEFRDYAKNQKTVKDAPKRNSLFRKILDFLKALFGKGSVTNLSEISTVKELFDNLYLGKNLNNYTPLIDNVMFDLLYRNSGIVKPGTETDQVLNRQDSNLLKDSMDSIISDIIDNEVSKRDNKGATLSILLDKRNREPLYNMIKQNLEAKLKTYETQLEETPENEENEYKRDILQNRIRIIQTGLENYGDTKSGLVQYHVENSSYDLVRQKYTALELDEEGNLVEPENATDTERYGDQKVNDKSLIQLAGKETLYILKSLYQAKINKKTGQVEYEYNELGFKKLADFRSTWNNTVRAIGGIQDPQQMYDKLMQESETVPEFKQLVQSKLPNPKVFTNNAFEFQATTSFWQDFSKTRVPYIQLTVFKNQIGEKIEYNNFTGAEIKIPIYEYDAQVTEASNEVGNIVRMFKENFRANQNNPYVERVGRDNTPMLNLGKVVDSFSSQGKLDVNQSYGFARALGFNLSDLSIIKNTLKKDNKTIEEFGLPYIFDIIKKLHEKEQLPNTNSTTRSLISKFRENPIETLSKGIPANIISTSEIIQKNKVIAIASLEARYGTRTSNSMVLNAEKNLVSEFIDNHTISKQVYALNNAKKLSDLWTTDEFKHMSYMDPAINSYTNRLGIIRSLYDLKSPEQSRRTTRSFLLFANSGTQVENEDGFNTTSLDVNSKMIQEMHTMLKDGVQEFMRHASKSSSFGARIEGGVIGLPGKEGGDNKLWVDLDMFGKGTAFDYALKSHLLPYMEAEAERIYRFKINKDEFKKYAGYNRVLSSGKMAGEEFTAFDDVISDSLKKQIYDAIDSAVKNKTLFNLSSFLKQDTTGALGVLRGDVKKYFDEQTKENLEMLQESKYISQDLKDRMKIFNLSDDQVEQKLVETFTYNSWIHNFEMGILFYGDFAQYNHYKEEMHKRNTGATSGGRGFRSDIAARNFVNGYLATTSYAKKQGISAIAYNGTFNTAIIQDVIRDSEYLGQIEKGLRKDYEKRYKNAGVPNAEKVINERLKIELSKYKGMEEGDGQGFITFDAYRTLRHLENAWSNEQEILFQRIAKGDNVTTSEIKELFPVYKVQHFGNLANTGLPINAMHKFALAPLIPSVIAGSDLENLHRQMMTKNIQYVTFQTGSKVGSVTSEVNDKGEAVADKIYDDKDQKSLKRDIAFTPNVIYLENLKNVTNVPNKFKNKTVFSTQLRKLILGGMYRNGKIINPKNSVAVKSYEAAVDAYSNILKLELLHEIGYEYNPKTKKYTGNIQDFLEVVQRELERKDLPEHLIQMVGLNRDKSIKTDLSLHLKADDIEKILVSLVEKRLIKQKVKGEALVQVASSMSNGMWDNKLKKATNADILKYMGTNNLPFYNNDTADGKTAAMKVAVALQGDFANLLKLNHLDGEVIGTRQRLNEMIKDDKWMDLDNNRKAVTISAVRIPVQGINSMEFMEIYDFLDPAAGNIIIPPSEIVAKSGADYDVDKLTTFMPSIDSNGQYVETGLTNDEVLKKVNELSGNERGSKVARALIKKQKAALENRLINTIKSILELPDNYAALVRPNDTYLLKDEIADVIQDDVIEYNRFKNVNSKDYRVNKKGEKVISPTRILESRYNLHKHDVNTIAKRVLGMIAIENALHPIFNSIGVSMPATYKDSIFDDSLGRYVDGKNDYDVRLMLPHNKTDDGRVSLSGTDTVDGMDNIGELFSQMMNGAVDVEKDAWIFFIQGNYEITPMITFLLKAGVPKETAILFASNPIVREYAKQQRIIKSAYSKVTGTIAENFIPTMGKYQAAVNALAKFGIKDGAQKVSQKKYYNAVTKATGASGILNSKGEFDLELMKKIIKNPNEPSLRNHMEAMFLHFIELEKSSRGFTTLKFLSNPDTKTSKTLQEVIRRNMSLEDAKAMSKIEEGTVDKLKETVLGTFFDNKLISDLIVPLFPLRNNDTVTNFILKTSAERAGAVAKRFGKGQDGTRSFITQFKNAIPNYIFQNYMSNFVDENGKLTSMPKNFNKMDVVSKVGVKNGAEIINGKLFVDDARLRKEYQEGLYYRNNTMPGNYSESGLRGLGALVIFESEAAYFRYVFERENQRNLYSLESLLKNKDFKKMRELTANDKEAYEAYINQRALINAFNRVAIMGLEGQSYTDMVLDMIEEFSQLKGRYPILSQFTIPNIKTGERVLTLNDKAMLKDPQLAEIYFENLKDLADENVKKVTDTEDNKRISKLFGLLPIMSMYQHGIGYSKYGFNEALPYEGFIGVMQTASEIFMKSQLNNDTLGNIFELMLDSPNRDFTNFVRDPKTYIAPKPVVQPVEEEVIMDANTPMIEDMLAMAQSAEEVPTQSDIKIPKVGDIVTISFYIKGEDVDVKAKIVKLENYLEANIYNKGFEVDLENIKTGKKYEIYVDPDGIISQFQGEKGLRIGTDNYIKEFDIDLQTKTTTTTQPSTSVKEVIPTYGAVQVATNPTKEFDKYLTDAISDNIKNNAYVENGSSSANLMFSYGWQWKGNNSKQVIGDKLIVQPAQVDFSGKGNPVAVKSKYFYDSKYNDGATVPNISELDFLKKHIEKNLGIDMSDYDIALNNIYTQGTNLFRHTDIDESNTAKNYPVVVYVLGNEHKVRIDDNGGGAVRGMGEMVNPKTLTLKNGDIYTFGMNGKGRFEAVHDVIRTNKTDDTFPPITLPDGRTINKYTVTFTFRRAADLEPGMPTTPAKITPTQQSTDTPITETITNKNTPEGLPGIDRTSSDCQ
jgi:hypothetical protein